MDGAAVGRFAPSPSGPLHFGSVTSAVASYLNVRAQRGRWLLRIDDLDPPREEAGAADAIIRTLEALGLHWDGAIVYQSQRLAQYRAALEKLTAAGQTFICTCSRRQVGPGAYPGTCRGKCSTSPSTGSVRVLVGDEATSFTDLLHGDCDFRLTDECGDFIVQRADGLTAYHLAVVVDDAAAGVTEVVRGGDLLDSTPRQIHLQKLLGFKHPRYAHLPVVLGGNGVKLSKQSHAQAIKPEHAPLAVFHALVFLGFTPPAELHGAAPCELLDWGLRVWRLDAVTPLSRSYPVMFADANMARSSV
mgnify:CR=1 FL=1|jgi:glutamyl-Q tRNA(Asp) synthetase